jgi:hypothetical protein
VHCRLVEDDLVGGIRELIDAPDRADAMAAAARQIALDHDWVALGRRFAAVVTQVIGSTPISARHR